MKIVKAGLKNAKPADLVGKSEHVEGAMTDNPSFPAPTPSLKDIGDARIELVKAIADAEGGAHAAVAIKNDAAKKLARKLVALARYVNSVSAGDVTMAASSGFDLTRVPDRIDKLDAPSKFEAVTGAGEGQVDLTWKAVRGGRMYQVFICDGDPLKDGIWRSLGYCSRSRFSVAGLGSGSKYAFRVKALGVVGEGPESETAVAKAA